jgi:hypothetical protein
MKIMNLLNLTTLLMLNIRGEAEEHTAINGCWSSAKGTFVTWLRCQTNKKNIATNKATSWRKSDVLIGIVTLY